VRRISQVKVVTESIDLRMREVLGRGILTGGVNKKGSTKAVAG